MKTESINQYPELMEEHRLKEMPLGYDQNLFNTLFKATEGLRKKLASEINPHRYGVEFEDIVSWLNVKFIFVFNKYYNQMPPDRLKGYLINSLKTYKNKILRKGYLEKVVQNPVFFTDELVEWEKTEGCIVEEVEPDNRLDSIYQYMKKHLSDDAYQVFDIQLNPPPFIVEGMKNLGIDNLKRIPPFLISKYLDLGTSPSAEKYINDLKREIQKTTYKAQCEFRD